MVGMAVGDQDPPHVPTPLPRRPSQVVDPIAGIHDRERVGVVVADDESVREERVEHEPPHGDLVRLHELLARVLARAHATITPAD
jgi:hypothetical protein